MSAARLSLLVSLAACTSNPTPPAIRSCGHAHNDQENARPLAQALELSFCSVEVDVHVVGDQILVGHDPEDLSPERTLEALYLEPLAASPRDIILMIDVKTDADSSWPALEQRLERHQLGGALVVITGNAARAAIATASPRRASIDGRIADLDARVDPALYPLISDKWTDHFTWVGGVERQAVAQRRKLEELVKRAHDAGHKVRLWQSGDRVEVWEAPLNEGVAL